MALALAAPLISSALSQSALAFQQGGDHVCTTPSVIMFARLTVDARHTNSGLLQFQEESLN